MSRSAHKFSHIFRQALSATLVLMVLCGVLFPCLLTGLSSLIFPHQAAGSLVEVNDEVIGAEHVGQEFTEDYFLWSRPSSCHYNVYREDENGHRFYNDGSEFTGLASGSYNAGPSNPALSARVESDLQAFLSKNPTVSADEVPTDLLTASGSGLDPHISPAAAAVQVPRIAEASGLSKTTVEEIIAQHTEGKVLGIFGENTVNVLAVNVDIAQKMGL